MHTESLMSSKYNNIPKISNEFSLILLIIILFCMILLLPQNSFIPSWTIRISSICTSSLKIKNMSTWKWNSALEAISMITLKRRESMTHKQNKPIIWFFSLEFKCLFRRLSEDETRKMSYQIILGLEYLHSNKVIHRDLKPGNVVLSATN